MMSVLEDCFMNRCPPVMIGALSIPILFEILSPILGLSFFFLGLGADMSIDNLLLSLKKASFTERTRDITLGIVESFLDSSSSLC